MEEPRAKILVEVKVVMVPLVAVKVLELKLVVVAEEPVAFTKVKF